MQRTNIENNHEKYCIDKRVDPKVMLLSNVIHAIKSGKLDIEQRKFVL